MNNTSTKPTPLDDMQQGIEYRVRGDIGGGFIGTYSGLQPGKRSARVQFDDVMFLIGGFAMRHHRLTVAWCDVECFLIREVR